MTWTQVECPFEKDKKIQSYLLTAPIYSEEGKGYVFDSTPTSLGAQHTHHPGSTAHLPPRCTAIILIPTQAH